MRPPAARRRAICEQEIKLNFTAGRGVRGCQGNDVALTLSFSLSPSLPVSSFSRGGTKRMRFGARVNPLVRNQSRPHRITRDRRRGRMGFRDFKRPLELRLPRPEGKGISKMPDRTPCEEIFASARAVANPLLASDKGEFHRRDGKFPASDVRVWNSIFRRTDGANSPPRSCNFELCSEIVDDERVSCEIGVAVSYGGKIDFGRVGTSQRFLGKILGSWC